MNAKKVIAGVMLIAGAMSQANAAVVFNSWTGLYEGNVCRSGPYYTMVSFSPIGSVCYNAAWNLPGVIQGS